MKYSLRTIVVVKVALLGAIAALAGSYLYLLANWGIRCHYAAPYVWVCSILAVTAAASAGVATLLLTPQNLRRVITSTIVMLICTAFGSSLGNPLMQGSYDHGGGESEIGCLTGGVIGALIGWAAVTAWAATTAGRYQDDASEPSPKPPQK